MRQSLGLRRIVKRLGLKFELIDNVLELEADRIVAIKNVTSAEEYLADHFPSFPVLPGVMMLETLVQAARILVAKSQNTGDTPLIMAQARNIRYGNMVKPGQSLIVEVTLKGEKDGQWQLVGTGKVDGSVAVQGKFAMAALNPTAA
ncbi:MAG: beta-hydroxyacyl-ACP dehydratase [Phycisphaeraceae bacterium]|nr:beta-hydroxyacyl-ACP dehydratase [Phycisphaeraceae bacterium]